MTDLPSPAFRTVVLDVDSTVSGIEGIDWLAARRGDVVARRVADLTNTAMQGGIPLEEVYGLRLNAIRPRREEVDALSRAYVDALAPGALETIGRLKTLGVQIVLVSGGLRHALLRMALHLGLSATDVHAVSLRFDAGGAYQGYDTGSPMTTVGRKAPHGRVAGARRSHPRRRRWRDRPRDARRRRPLRRVHRIRHPTQRRRARRCRRRVVRGARARCALTTRPFHQRSA